MNGKDLLAGLNFVPEELIQEAILPRHRPAASFVRWVGFAACLALMLTGSLFGLSLLHSKMNSISSYDALVSNGSAQENAPEAKPSFIFWNTAGTAAPVYGQTPEAGGNLEILWEYTQAELPPWEAFSFGDATYTPDTWEYTWLEGYPVFLVLGENGTRIARFAADGRLYTAVGVLDEEAFLTALESYLKTLG